MNNRHREEQQNAESAAAASSEIATEPTTEDVSLVANEEGAVYTLVATYYNAMATGDETTLRSVCDEISDKDMYRYLELAQYIDYYPTLEIYTKTGPEEGSVIAYVYYKIAFVGHEEEVPGYQALYICTNDQGEILRELCEHSLAGKNIRYHLVVGRFNPNREKLEQYASEHNNVVLHCDVKDMAGLMTACQLAVTAGGTTIYELSVLGVPFVCFSYAENQEGLTEWLGKQEIAGYAGKWHYTPEETRKAIGSWCRNVCENRELRQRTYEAERTLIDGQGAARIAEILQTAGIEE
jgi:hypothetical protein